ncbi:MAG: hypothetical protein [Arizlama microvirus]|nr:MAG: hypothetical protein [Arizlama microvirus]
MGKPPEQMDIEKGPTDRAAQAVRDFQKGQCTSSFLRACLKELSPNQMLWVSLATRVPSGTLEKLRADAGP